MDKAEQKALSDIEKYGCHVIHVIGEHELPPFSYSIGIWKSSNASEIVVVGLKQKVAHFAINEYNRRIKEGETFSDGQTVCGFLEGFNCIFNEIDKTKYEKYMGWNRWLYGGNNFPALQLVYPSTDGIWPWQVEASDWFRQRQPLLFCLPTH